jgi:hypothetical protein
MDKYLFVLRGALLFVLVCHIPFSYATSMLASKQYTVAGSLDGKKLFVFYFNILAFIKILVGFGRACAPVRCAHPSYWAYMPNGALRAPRPWQLRCFLFIPQK